MAVRTAAPVYSVSQGEIMRRTPVWSLLYFKIYFSNTFSCKKELTKHNRDERKASDAENKQIHQTSHQNFRKKNKLLHANDCTAV